MYPVLIYALVVLVTCFRVYSSSNPISDTESPLISPQVLCICLTALLPLFHDTESSEAVIANEVDLVRNCTYDFFKESSTI